MEEAERRRPRAPGAVRRRREAKDDTGQRRIPTPALPALDDDALGADGEVERPFDLASRRPKWCGRRRQSVHDAVRRSRPPPVGSATAATAVRRDGRRAVATCASSSATTASRFLIFGVRRYRGSAEVLHLDVGARSLGVETRIRRALPHPATFRYHRRGSSHRLRGGRRAHPAIHRSSAIHAKPEALPTTFATSADHLHIRHEGRRSWSPRRARRRFFYVVFPTSSSTRSTSANVTNSHLARVERSGVFRFQPARSLTASRTPATSLTGAGSLRCQRILGPDSRNARPRARIFVAGEQRAAAAGSLAAEPLAGDALRRRALGRRGVDPPPSSAGGTPRIPPPTQPSPCSAERRRRAPSQAGRADQRSPEAPRWPSPPPPSTAADAGPPRPAALRDKPHAAVGAAAFGRVASPPSDPRDNADSITPRRLDRCQRRDAARLAASVRPAARCPRHLHVFPYMERAPSPSALRDARANHARRAVIRHAATVSGASTVPTTCRRRIAVPSWRAPPGMP